MSIKGLLVTQGGLEGARFPDSEELTSRLLLTLEFTGCPASWGPWGKATPVSGGHAAHLQVHPHASGWGAL